MAGIVPNHSGFGKRNRFGLSPHEAARTRVIAVVMSDDGKRFVVHADEKLTAFFELKAAIRASGQNLVAS
jgi:hypothetical protein